MVYGIAASSQHIYARPGKSVWVTIGEAFAALKHNPGYVVFAYRADWWDDCQVVPGQSWRALNVELTGILVPEALPETPRPIFSAQ